MSLLLLICLTLACLPIEWRTSVFGLSHTGSAAVTGGIVVGLLLVAHVFSHRTVAGLTGGNPDREAIGRAHGLRRLVYFFLNLSGFGFALIACGWGNTVNHALTFHGLLMPGSELVLLAPFLIGMIGGWAIFYDAERLIHLTSPDPAMRGEFWTRRGYVVFLLRHHFLMVFTPILLIVVQLGALRADPELFASGFAKLAAFLGLLLFILLLPSLVPLVLGLKPMPPCRLRDRLEAAARRLGVRYRNLYIWDTRKNLATAMVTGLIPRLRHVVFTDLLLATMTEDEVEAVFGHEIGHVRHGHLLYYVAFLMLSFLTLGMAFRTVELSVAAELQEDAWPLVLTVVATGAYLFLVFGFVSRRCERQADVFGCKAVSCADAKCAGHTADTALIPRGKALCRTGVDTFVKALERVEEVNGMSRGSLRAGRGGLFGRLAGMLRFVGVWLATWQHSTIANRIEFLRSLTEDPRRERQFQRRVTVLRWGLLILLAVGVAGVVGIYGWQRLLEEV
jgi:Zn-dependent protease with chaperone function